MVAVPQRELPLHSMARPGQDAVEYADEVSGPKSGWHERKSGRNIEGDTRQSRALRRWCPGALRRRILVAHDRPRAHGIPRQHKTPSGNGGSGIQSAVFQTFQTGEAVIMPEPSASRASNAVCEILRPIRAFSRLGFKELLRVFKDTVIEWSNDKVLRLGASLAFYT